jgi:hypothetical protein
MMAARDSRGDPLRTETIRQLAADWDRAMRRYLSYVGLPMTALSPRLRSPATKGSVHNIRTAVHKLRQQTRDNPNLTITPIYRGTLIMLLDEIDRCHMTVRAHIHADYLEDLSEGWASEAAEALREGFPMPKYEDDE